MAIKDLRGDNMEWNVYYHDFNGKKIRLMNIFKHSGFKKEVEDHLRKIKDKEEFAEELRKSLLYYFWSKCEYEVVVKPWCAGDGVDEIKIDIYDQVMANFNIFVDYVWGYKWREE